MSRRGPGVGARVVWARAAFAASVLGCFVLMGSDLPANIINNHAVRVVPLPAGFVQVSGNSCMVLLFEDIIVQNEAADVDSLTCTFKNGAEAAYIHSTGRNSCADENRRQQER